MESRFARDTGLVRRRTFRQALLFMVPFLTFGGCATKEAAKAQLYAANAQVQQALRNLEWTKVYSPIGGVAGVATSQVGDLVGPTTKMTTISKVNPIRAYFSISANAYLQSSAKVAAVV